MTDQAQAVEIDDLADLIGDEDLDETEELAEESEQPEEPEESEESEPEQEKYRVKVKNERGEDEEKDLSLEELAEGYMLQKDYTHKRQVEAEQVRQVEHKYYEAVTQNSQQSAEVIDQLKAYVFNNANRELANFNPRLAAEDPAEYVRLQALQMEFNQTLNQLDQTKQHMMQQSKQAEEQAKGSFLSQNREYLKQTVPEFGTDDFAAKITGFTEKTYGITKADLAFLTNTPVFKDGGMLDGGRVLHILNDAMKWHNLQAGKPNAMKKVAEAPRTIKPATPQQKSKNAEASKRLAKYGRTEDLANFL